MSGDDQHQDEFRGLILESFWPRAAKRWFERVGSPRRRIMPFRPTSQALEERLCFSAVTFSVNNDVLTVRGTNQADQILVRAGSTVEVLTDAGLIDTAVSPSSLTRLVVLARAGDDHVEIDASLRQVPATLLGGDGDDTLIGSDAADLLYGQDGDDSLFGNGGNDRLRGGDGADNLFGGNDDDTVWIDAEDLAFDGGLGSDLAFARGSSSGVTLDMAAGRFEIAYGSDFDDIITAAGLTERAIIFGYAGDDILTGSDFDDRIAGHDGDDLIRGGDGNDNISGNAGADELYGEGGDDTVQVDAADTTTTGGEGRDAAHARRAPTGVTIDMAAGGFEIAYGSDFDDIFLVSSPGETSPRLAAFGYGGSDRYVVTDIRNDLISIRDTGEDGLQDEVIFVPPVDSVASIIPQGDSRGLIRFSGVEGTIRYFGTESVVEQPPLPIIVSARDQDSITAGSRFDLGTTTIGTLQVQEFLVLNSSARDLRLPVVTLQPLSEDAAAQSLPTVSVTTSRKGSFEGESTGLDEGTFVPGETILVTVAFDAAVAGHYQWQMRIEVEDADSIAGTMTSVLALELTSEVRDLSEDEVLTLRLRNLAVAYSHFAERHPSFRGPSSWNDLIDARLVPPSYPNEFANRNYDVQWGVDLRRVDRSAIPSSQLVIAYPTEIHGPSRVAMMDGSVPILAPEEIKRVVNDSQLEFHAVDLIQVYGRALQNGTSPDSWSDLRATINGMTDLGSSRIDQLHHAIDRLETANTQIVWGMQSLNDRLVIAYTESILSTGSGYALVSRSAQLITATIDELPGLLERSGGFEE